MTTLRDFSSQIELEVLEALQAIAQQEGRQLQAVVGDALREYVTQKERRSNTIDAFKHSLKEYDELYHKLAL